MSQDTPEALQKSLGKLKGLLEQGDYESFSAQAHDFLKGCLLDTKQEARRVLWKLSLSDILWHDRPHVEFFKQNDSEYPEDAILEQMILQPEPIIQDSVYDHVQQIKDRVVFENLEPDERQTVNNVLSPEFVRNMGKGIVFEHFLVYFTRLGHYAEDLRKFRIAARDLNKWFKEHPILEKTVHYHDSEYRELRWCLRHEYHGLETQFTRSRNAAAVFVNETAYPVDKDNPAKGKVIPISLYPGDFGKIHFMEGQLSGKEVDFDTPLERWEDGSYMLTISPKPDQPKVEYLEVGFEGTTLSPPWGSRELDTNLLEGANGISVINTGADGNPVIVKLNPPSDLIGTSPELVIKYKSPYIENQEHEFSTNVTFKAQ